MHANIYVLVYDSIYTYTPTAQWFLQHNITFMYNRFRSYVQKVFSVTLTSSWISCLFSNYEVLSWWLVVGGWLW